MKDTVTLTLDGHILAPLLARVVQHYNGLLLAIAVDLALKDRVEWSLDGFIGADQGATEAGIVLRGEAEEPTEVETIVDAYGIVGKALEAHKPVPYSHRVQQEARAITRVLNGDITTLRFQTPDLDATVYSEGLVTTPLRPMRNTYGAITGRIQTLTNRQGLRFTLYDALHDKAVTCFLEEGREELMRGMWGKMAIVEGWISRDALTGRPIAIRHVSNVTPKIDVEPGSFRLARGALPVPAGGEPPETIIRRLRDA
jgi:hypothetical protein